jgi:DNA-binding NarL/FixJ family response regulator
LSPDHPRAALAATGRPVLVIDADEVARSRVADTLRRAGYLVHEALTAAEGLELGRATASVVAAIIAVELPDATGYELCREFRDEYGERIAIFLVSATRTAASDRVAGLLVGADDYLAKPVEPDELLARLRGMSRLQSPFRSSFGLTPRELEVLGHLARGSSQGRIAEDLVISPRTVGTHIQHILGKLGAHSRAEAVALAHRHGLEGISDLTS